MKVDKLIKAEMNREYFFVKGNIPIDTKYFIEKINQGVNESDNNSYKTNVSDSELLKPYIIHNKGYKGLNTR